MDATKAETAAVVFLVIFLLFHGLMSKEFTVQNWKLTKAFGVSRILLLMLI